MLRQIYEKIKSGDEIRKNLISLKQELKKSESRMAFLYYLAGDYEVFIELLNAEDPKVRKNTALIMGELGVQSFLDQLFDAYNKETTMFVKADYLTAMSKLDYRSLLPDFKERLDQLVASEVEESNLKHINEEKKLLTKMILDIEGVKKHRFIGYDVMSDLILLTNRDHKEETLHEIKNGTAKTFNAGVMVRTNDLREILTIRTYSDLLFRVKNVLTVPMEPNEAADVICNGGVLKFLEQRHEGKAPFYFRLEIKSKMALSEKSQYAKKLAAAIEEKSGRKLLNSTSNYEVELRLIENKEGAFNVLIKLYSIPDDRFAYRKHAVAASIQPVQAALIAALSKDYLKERAQVLDPFCGVGTMLIERNKLVKATPMYGIDIFGEAIDKAIDNARRADVAINFINRDFFDFKHDYLFDEIFTNMPTRGSRKTEEEMTLLYRCFFIKALEVLKDEAVIIMYTRDKKLALREMALNKAYSLEKEYIISKKEDAYLLIIKVNQ